MTSLHFVCGCRIRDWTTYGCRWRTGGISWGRSCGTLIPHSRILPQIGNLILDEANLVTYPLYPLSKRYEQVQQKEVEQGGP